MSEYNSGDIVLVNFPFTDQSSVKVRPTLVISVKEEDIIVLGIFSYIPEKIKDSWVIIEDKYEYFSQTGLKKTSVVKTEKITIIHNSIVIRKIGSLPENILKGIKNILKKTLEVE